MTTPQPTPEHRITSFIARQFGLPSGPAGHLVARLLARGNAGFNRWLVGELSSAVNAPRTVIELGCGPGIALQQLLITYPESRVVGVDPSPVVLKTARRRNGDSVKAGRLELITGDAATAIGYGPADLIVACHVLYFWTNLANELQRIREALTPTGHLALGYQLRHNMPPISQRAFPAEGFILYDSDDQLATALENADFTSPEIRIFGGHDHPMGRLALTTPATDRRPSSAPATTLP